LAYRMTSRSRDTSVEYPYPSPSAEPYSLHDVEQYGDDDMDSDEYHDRRAATMDDRRAVSNTTSTLETMGRKHVCPTCFKRFNRPSSLRIHVNTHTGATRKLYSMIYRVSNDIFFRSRQHSNALGPIVVGNLTSIPTCEDTTATI
jgi:hypothetical protein